MKKILCATCLLLISMMAMAITPLLTPLPRLAGTLKPEQDIGTTQLVATLSLDE